MNSLLAVKLFALFVDPLETALGALIPWALGRHKNAERLLSIATAAAAGIFFSVGICHMQADAINFLADLTEHTHGLPLSLFLMSIGFSVMLMLDQVIFPHHEHHYVQPPKPQGSPKLSINADEELKAGLLPEKDIETPVYHGPSIQKPSAMEGYIKAGVITFGVMLHSSICGLAIGVAREMSSLIATVIACLAHDWSHASALIVLYNELGLSKLASGIYFGAFVAVEPIATAIGIGVTSALDDKSAQIASGVLSAVSSGVFVYISVCELVQESFVHQTRDRRLKFALFFAFMVGIAAVSVID